MPINLGNNKIKYIYLCSTKIKKVYLGSTKIYSSGNIVTYHVDTGTTYQEEVDDGESVLSPKTFTPTKSGWYFVGWKTNSTANGDVLSSKVMGDDPITLYAVFRQTITVTYYNNSTTASKTTGYRYYNNNNIANPSFKLTQAASSGWTARGWSTTNKGNASITYNNGATFTRDSSITLYGLYQRTITLSYAGNGNTGGSTAAQTGTQYWAPAGAINPSFTVKANGFTRTNYIFTGWKSGSTAYAVGQSVTLSANLTLTAQWYTAAATNFAYTGGIQSWTVPVTGLYLLRCIGAGGGAGMQTSGDDSPYCSYGGNGGYSYYYVKLTAGQTLYVVVGGGGRRGYDGYPVATGGYNGGGDSGIGSGPSGYGGSGGGATHIASVSGLLSSVNKSNLYIVAGGGGGGGGKKRINGGSGGGNTASNGTRYYGIEYGNYGIAGSQTAGGQTGGSYGKGGSVSNHYNGGGGAGIYGGGSGGQSGGGGGGSGYIPSTTTTYEGKTYTNSNGNGNGASGGHTNDVWHYAGNFAETYGGNGSASVQLIAA